MELLGLTPAQFSLWLLFFMRTGAFVFLAPLLSARSAPTQFRIALTFLLTVISFAAWAPLTPAPPTGPGDFASLALSEIALGLIMAFIVGLVFVTFHFAGQFIGYQMGFAIVNVLDPQSQSQVSLVSQYLFTAAILAFLSLNLHHGMIGLWYKSYEVAPVGGFDFTTLSTAAMTHALDDMVLLAFRISLPLLAFLLLTDLALGIVARVMPQMNVFIVGIPLKIAIGLLVLSLVILQFDPMVRDTTKSFINRAGEFLHEFSRR